VIILAWTAVGLFEAIPETLKSLSWWVFLNKIIDAWGWAMLTPVILLIDRRLSAREQNAARLAVFYLLLCVPFTFVHTYLAAVLLYPFPQITWSPLRNPDYTVFYNAGGFVTYCAFIGILQSFKYYDRFRTSQLNLERVEKRLLESRLNALRLQLEPHFLFNALNTISSEMVANPELAREMIENLGTLLRRSLDSQGSTEITLAEELALLDHYLAIQRLRFGSRIEIEVDVDPSTLATMVPSMLLQPLVENAIRHGLDRRVTGGRISVSATEVGDRLDIRIIDDGVGLPRNWEMKRSRGIGLRTTQERLEALYPGLNEHGFRLTRRKKGGTEVAILLPLRRAGAKASDLTN